MKSVKGFSSYFVAIVFLFVTVAFQLVKPAQAAVPFTQAYSTLTNSRFSFKGSLASGISTGNAVATIAGSGFSDNNTQNLFNGDVICLNGNTGKGCIGGTTFTVNNVLNATSLAFTPTLTGSAMAGDSVVSTQSGQMTISFRPTTNIASGSKVILLIPATSVAAHHNDGIPDSSGFDSAELPADLLAGTCAANVCFSPSGFTVSAVALAAAITNHTITITTSAALNNSTTYSFTLGHASNAKLRFLNPSPAGTTHTRGVSDTYSFNLTTKDSGETITYDETNMKVAPIDGVFVSANVELSISYSINDGSNGYSGNINSAVTITQCPGTWTTTSATTATAVPFGSILNFDSFYRAAQSHYVVTNATNGFDLTVKYDNPLTSGANQIADGGCDTSPSCTTTSQQAWSTSTFNGFGYTLGNITGSEAAWTGDTYRIFGSTPVTIMSKATPSTGSRIAMCYQLSVDATQPNGLYYNKLTYVATPKF
ncbi:MAG: hypothetical protein WC775_04980 [Patescibacteria group bacterium]|jgi:hypothetical protein